MSKKAGSGPQNPNVANMDAGPSKCKFEECSKKSKKFGFCDEHYELYMAGVIRGDGLKPCDYEAKLENYLRKRKVA